MKTHSLHAWKHIPFSLQFRYNKATRNIRLSTHYEAKIIRSSFSHTDATIILGQSNKITVIWFNARPNCQARPSPCTLALWNSSSALQGSPYWVAYDQHVHSSSTHHKWPDDHVPPPLHQQLHHPEWFMCRCVDVVPFSYIHVVSIQLATGCDQEISPLKSPSKASLFPFLDY